MEGISVLEGQKCAINGVENGCENVPKCAINGVQTGPIYSEKSLNNGSALFSPFPLLHSQKELTNYCPQKTSQQHWRNISENREKIEPQKIKSDKINSENNNTTKNNPNFIPNISPQVQNSNLTNSVPYKSITRQITEDYFMGDRCEEDYPPEEVLKIISPIKEGGDDILPEKKSNDICLEKKGDDICSESKGDNICSEKKGDNMCSEKEGDNVFWQNCDKMNPKIEENSENSLTNAPKNDVFWLSKTDIEDSLKPLSLGKWELLPGRLFFLFTEKYGLTVVLNISDLVLPCRITSFVKETRAGLLTDVRVNLTDMPPNPHHLHPHCEQNVKTCKQNIKNYPENVQNYHENGMSCEENIQKNIENCETKIENREKRIENCQTNMGNRETNMQNCENHMENCETNNENCAKNMEDWGQNEKKKGEPNVISHQLLYPFLRVPDFFPTDSKWLPRQVFASLGAGLKMPPRDELDSGSSTDVGGVPSEGEGRTEEPGEYMEKSVEKNEIFVEKNEKIVQTYDKTLENTEQMIEKSGDMTEKTEKMSEKTEKMSEKTEKMTEKMTEKISEKTEQMTEKTEKCVHKVGKSVDKQFEHSEKRETSSELKTNEMKTAARGESSGSVLRLKKENYMMKAGAASIGNLAGDESYACEGGRSYNTMNKENILEMNEENALLVKKSPPAKNEHVSPYSRRTNPEGGSKNIPLIPKKCNFGGENIHQHPTSLTHIADLPIHRLCTSDCRLFERGESISVYDTLMPQNTEKIHSQKNPANSEKNPQKFQTNLQNSETNPQKFQKTFQNSNLQKSPNFPETHPLLQQASYLQKPASRQEDSLGETDNFSISKLEWDFSYIGGSQAELMKLQNEGVVESAEKGEKKEEKNGGNMVNFRETNRKKIENIIYNKLFYSQNCCDINVTQIYTFYKPVHARLQMAQKCAYVGFFQKLRDFSANPPPVDFVSKKNGFLVNPLQTFPQPCCVGGEDTKSSKKKGKNKKGSPSENFRNSSQVCLQYMSPPPMSLEMCLDSDTYAVSFGDEFSNEVFTKLGENGREQQEGACNFGLKPRYKLDRQGKKIIRNCYEIDEDRLSVCPKKLEGLTSLRQGAKDCGKSSFDTNKYLCEKNIENPPLVKIKNPPLNPQNDQSYYRPPSHAEASYKQGKNWAYIIDDFDTDQYDEDLLLPSVLAEECKLLAGLREPLTVRCNMSLANHRLSAAMEKSNAFSFLQQDSSPGKSEIPPGDMEFAPNASELEDQNIAEGELVRVTYPSEFAGIHEEDLFRLWKEETITEALQKLAELCSPNSPPDMSPINLAQYCQTIFWNIVRLFQGDLEKGIGELAPQLSIRTKRRKRPLPLLTEAAEAEEMKKVRLEERREKVKLRQLEHERMIDFNFQKMQAKYSRDAHRKVERMNELHDPTDNGMKKRLPCLADHDEQAIIDSVIDLEYGIFKRPVRKLTEHQKRVIYQKCLQTHLNAPIFLDKILDKGRAVLAAASIAKDDFVLEYKGELLTDRRARSMDMKYNRCVTHQKGSFMFYFKYNGKNFAIDSTSESRNFGVARLINHSRHNPNLLPKTLLSDSSPHLFFVAKRDIRSGEELLVDYGERDPSVIKNNPWLEN